MQFQDNPVPDQLVQDRSYFPHLDNVALLCAAIGQPATQTEYADLETCWTKVAKDL